MKTEIIPSILVGTKKKLMEQIKKVRRYSKIAQFDICDGKFVKNKTVQFSAFKDIKIGMKFEVHLMVLEPEKQVIDWRYLGADKIIIHYEACGSDEKVHHVINLIRRNKIKAGLALNPGTSAEKVKPFLDKIDTVLVMTVHPGKQGRKFLKGQLKKIKQIRKFSKTINIEVDGGIDDETIGPAKEAGANLFCVGSFLVKSRNYKKSLNELKKAMT